MQNISQEKNGNTKPAALCHKFYLEKASVFIFSGKLIKTIKWAFILYLLFSNEGGFPSL